VYRSPAARFAFKHVYVDAGSRGLYRGRELVSFFGRDFLATVATGQTSRGLERDLEDVRGVQVEEKTLESYGFVTGDLLSVAISVPEPRPAPNGTSIRGAFAREREHIQVQREKEWERVHHPPTRPERRAAERPGSTRAPEGDWRADRDRDRGLDRAEPPHLARGGRERGYRRSASPSRREREPWGRRRD
jgi:histone deacetylase complex subunit SAP18